MSRPHSPPIETPRPSRPRRGPRPRAGRSWAPAGTLEALEARVVPATIVVTSPDDAGPGTLRAAIALANATADPDTITFDESVRGPIALLSGLPALGTPMELVGPGASELAVVRDPASILPFAILEVISGTVAEIAGLTLGGSPQGAISNSGTLTVSDCTIFGVKDARLSLIRNSGTLDVTRSTITGNAMITGNTIPAGGYGAGIRNSGTLAVSQSTITGNSAPFGVGGGIFNDGTLTVAQSMIAGNSAPSGTGGGISNTGTLTVIGSTIAGNTATYGGGLANAGRMFPTPTALAVVDSTISGNTAESGGGIHSSNTFTVTRCTISGNAADVGGGILLANWNPSTTLEALELANSLLANSRGGNLALALSTRLLSGGHNLFSDAPSVALDLTDLINTDPLLSPLGDHGGPTWTHALLPGSPAIDAAGAAGAGQTDQRGVPRPQGSAPDIGAFESRGFTIVASGGGGQSAEPGTAFAAPLTATVASAHGEPVAGGRVVFQAPAAGASAVLDPYVATIGLDGRALARATANAVVGEYAVLARVGGGAATFAMANAFVPPRVLSVIRLGIHAEPTLLRLAFSEPLDAAGAENPRNYTIVPIDARGRARGRAIAVATATYDPAAGTVTLRPFCRLDLHGSYRLTVSAAAPGGVRSADMVYLDGAGNGTPGTNYVAIVRGFRGTPAGPVVPVRVTPRLPSGPAARRSWR